MTIDIRGVNTHNKGAHLMMCAIAQRIGDRFDLSTSPNGSEYKVRAQLGLEQTLLLNQAPALSATVGNLVPRKVRRAFGLASDSDLTGVLDAAGFAYSDSFSSERSRRESVHANRWKRRGVPLVFLPQAFGPFKKADQRKWTTKLLSDASIVFARDSTSLEYVRNLGAPIDVRLSPDFTIGLTTTDIPSPVEGQFAAIVPNSKMVSHTELGEQEYVTSLVDAALGLKAKGIRPVVVIHEFNDIKLGARVSEQLDCEMFRHSDPLVLKKVLGDATAAVASRFHAIVGALSQGTPVLAYGWSHKYQELLTDFGYPDWALKPGEDVAAKVELLFASADVLAVLAERGSILKQQNDRMWDEVAEILA